MAKGPDLFHAGTSRGLRLLAAAALGLCPIGAGAQETKIGENPISVMMKWRPTAEPPDMPDFVKRTRPPEDQLKYTPLTGVDPARPARKSPAELAATMQKLDAAAANARGRAASVPNLKPVVRRPAARQPDPVAAED